MGKTALVLGNGESRSAVNIKQFPHDILIGCNAAHRDFKLDYLVCCDKRTVQEAVESKVENIYTRNEWAEKFNVNTLPSLPYEGYQRVDQPRHWGSGGYAVLLATTIADTVMLVGFDLYGIETYSNPGSLTVRPLDIPQVNNIYKGTRNYAEPTSTAIDYSYWVYQLAKLFEIFHKHKFVIVNKADWKMPKEWQKNNVEFVAL